MKQKGNYLKVGLVIIIVIASLVGIFNSVNRINQDLKTLNGVNTRDSVNIAQDEIRNTAPQKNVSEVLPPVSKYNDTRAGVTLSVNDYAYETKGENYGAVKDIHIFIINNGASNIFPTLTVEVYDKNGDRNKGNLKEINLAIILGHGESYDNFVPLDLDVNNINLTKIMNVKITDYPDTLAQVVFETNLGEGYK